MKPKAKPTPTAYPKSLLPLEWVTKHFATSITLLAGGVTAITGIYGTLGSPGTDLLQLLALALTLLALVIAGLAFHLLTHRKRPKANGGPVPRAYYYNDEQRRSVIEESLKEVGFTAANIAEIVKLTGSKGKTKPGFTYSDLTQRLLPTLVHDAYPDNAIAYKRALEIVKGMKPTPQFQE